MAVLEHRKNKDGSFSYRVQIRRNGVTIYKTFNTEEDARVFLWYKERLIDNMKNYELSLKETISFFHTIDLKCASMKNPKEIERMRILKVAFSEHFGGDKFLSKLTYDDWVNFAKYLLQKDVYRGAKTEVGKRKMSISTLRRTFAYISSCFSYAQSKGIDIENHPLMVIRTFISPKLNSQ